MSSFSAQATIAADWLVAMPDVLARLEAAARPRIADVGCSQGFSILAIAKAFLGAHVDGFDLGPASIADARRHAAEAGLDARVRFIEADTAELATRGPYELILIREALHDMARPLDALRAAREALVSGGTVLVAALGTVMRMSSVRQLADQAGYTRLEVLPVENAFFRLYRLDP
jgi:2-polyprenyl-3-methyl-5-hydroxy-6-metoxy-1,4-benzoquinol methylase